MSELEAAGNGNERVVLCCSVSSSKNNPDVRFKHETCNKTTVKEKDMVKEENHGESFWFKVI